MITTKKVFKAIAPEVSYPKLMVNRKGTVVKFLREGYGFVLHDAEGLGDNDDPEGWDMNNFKLYYGEVICRNDL